MAAYPEDHGFAVLVPSNADAQKAFSGCIEDMQTNGDEFHLRFLEKSVLSPAEEVTSSDTGGVSSEHNTDRYPCIEREQYQGHYILSFGKSRLPKRPNQGWTVGKGERFEKDHNVDFLLAWPRDPVRKHIAKVHVFLRFHRRSGLLMLVSASPEKAISYLVDDKWVRLQYPSQHVLFQRVNKLRIHRLEYDLIYTWPEDQASMGWFHGIRDAYMEQYHGGQPLRHQEIPGIPPNGGFTKFHDILMFNTAASGRFGWVSNGVDANTGDPVAIKEVRIESERDIDVIKDELRMGKDFRGVPGLLPTLKSWCEHHHTEPCGRIPERVHLVSPLGSRDFKDQDWNQIKHTTQISLLKQTLLGLKELHHRGIMHRDITRKNLLVLSVELPDAAVFDYGKAVYATNNTNTFIGPISTLAPEVYLGTPYNNKIDVWAWAYAISETLGYKCPPGLKHDARIDVKRNAKLQSFLNIKAAAEPQKRALVELLIDMLSWNPKDRPSLADTLDYPCWDDTDEEEAFTACEGVLCAKRVRTSGKGTLLEEEHHPMRGLQQYYRTGLDAQRTLNTPAEMSPHPPAADGPKLRKPISHEAHLYYDGPTQPFSAHDEADKSISSAHALRSDCVGLEALADECSDSASRIGTTGLLR